jgi:hypothetical protein
MLNAIVVDTIVVDDLIKSKCSSGFKGVCLNKGRYQAQCNTTACNNHYLGCFGTPEEAAQAYLQHCQTHPEALEKEQQRAPRSDQLLSSGGPQSLKRLAGWADMQKLLKNSK